MYRHPVSQLSCSSSVIASLRAALSAIEGANHHSRRREVLPFGMGQVDLPARQRRPAARCAARDRGRLAAAGRRCRRDAVHRRGRGARRGPVLWVVRRRDLFGVLGLYQAGLAPERVLMPRRRTMPRCWR
ncbi:hypothetical protein AB5I41_19795 [Sphingomonas sp. MMS24-JH45]